jgi:VanZ family protein
MRMSVKMRWLLVVGYAVVVAGLSLLPSGSGPLNGWDTAIRPSVQKFGHMAVYAVFAILLLVAFPAIRKFSVSGLVVVFFVCTAYGALLEAGQLMVPGRTASVFDAAINATGVAVGLVLGKAWLAFGGTQVKQAGRNRSTVGDR